MSMKNSIDIIRNQTRGLPTCNAVAQPTAPQRTPTYIYIYMNYIQQSPFWESNSSSDSQEIPRILWNLEFHHCVHNSPQLVPIPSQINLVHTPSYLFNIPFNIILSSTPRSSKWFQYLRFLHQNPVCNSPHPHTCHMLCPPRYSWLYHPC